MRALVVIVALGLLQSCFMADRVMTDSPVASDVVGKCFVLTGEATRIRFQYSKVDLLYGGRPTDDEWVRRSKLRILGTVPKGGKIIIVRVVDAFNGETVRRWQVFGTLKDSNGNSVDVEKQGRNFASKTNG